MANQANRRFESVMRALLGLVILMACGCSFFNPPPSNDTTNLPTADVAGGDTGSVEPDVIVCEPSCGDRECGDDGCEGSCGECGENEFCTDEGRCEALPVECEDLDHDGFKIGADCEGDLDCDDTDPSVHPDAPEMCNAADDNCDGAIDEWYLIGESCFGSYGRCAWFEGVMECHGFFGAVCSVDPDGSESQAMTEMCNGIDDNCDGAIDEGVCEQYECDTDAQCWDGNPCTIDECVLWECWHSPNVGAICDDGNACTASAICDEAGTCQPTVQYTCDDGNSCTLDQCDSASGCVAVPVADGTPCEIGVCKEGVCEWRCRQDADCEDGNPWTVDACDDTGLCRANNCPDHGAWVVLPASGTWRIGVDVHGGEWCNTHPCENDVNVLTAPDTEGDENAHSVWGWMYPWAEANNLPGGIMCINRCGRYAQPIIVALPPIGKIGFKCPQDAAPYTGM